MELLSHISVCLTFYETIELFFVVAILFAFHLECVRV